MMAHIEQDPVARFELAADVGQQRIGCASLHLHDLHAHAAVFPFQPVIRAKATEVCVVVRTNPQHPGELLLVAVRFRDRGKLCRRIVVFRVDAQDGIERVSGNEHGFERERKIIRFCRHTCIRQICDIGHLHGPFVDHGLLFLGVGRLCDVHVRRFVVAGDMPLDQRGLLSEQPVEAEPAVCVGGEGRAAQQRGDGRREQCRPDRTGRSFFRFFKLFHGFIQDPFLFAALQRGQRILFFRCIAHEFIPRRLHRTALPWSVFF